MRNLALIFAPLMLFACVAERQITPRGGGGGTPSDDGGSNLTITIPGGFSVASTRLDPATEEIAIDNLWMLTFAVDGATGATGALESVEQIASDDIYPTADPNRHTIRIYPTTGTSRIILLANATDLDSVFNLFDPVAPYIIYWDELTETMQLGSWNATTGGEVTSQNQLFFQFGSVVGFTNANDSWGPGDIKFNPTTTANATFENGSTGWALIPKWNGSDTTDGYISSANYHTATNVKAGRGDPCKLVGLTATWVDVFDKYTPQFRLPTDAENAAAGWTKSGSYPGIVTETHYGMTNANAQGTTPAGSFLPASGSRDYLKNSGAPFGVGGYGFYWSSKPFSATHGHNLFLDSSVHSDDIRPVSNGFPVRCVRDAGGTRALTRAGVGDVTVGQTYEQVMAQLVGDLGHKMYEDGGAIPMWGEATITVVGDTAPNVDVDLYRAIAKIEVGAGAWDGTDGWAGLSNFEMTSVTVARPNNKYSVIPGPENISADDPSTPEVDESGEPNAPSIPGVATADPADDPAAFSLEDSEALFTFAATAGAPITDAIYVPEAEIVSAAHGDRMALVIGGLYQTDTTPKYYRVEFRNPAGDLVDVVRNHLYRFAITAVNGPGSDDIEAAYNTLSSYMNVTVVGWNEENFPTEIGR